MFLWFLGGSGVVVGGVLQDPAVAYRLVILGAVLSDGVDAAFGGARPLPPPRPPRSGIGRGVGRPTTPGTARTRRVGSWGWWCWLAMGGSGGRPRVVWRGAWTCR